MKTQTRQLMWHGMLLFLLGLITGLHEQRFTNVRMGLAAHLEGAMNGIFLLALGAAWSQVTLPHPVKMTACWAALYGTYVNWLVTFIAAAFGTAAGSPITSAGHSGQPWREGFVATGFITVSIAIIATSILVLWVFEERPPRQLGRHRILCHAPGVLRHVMYNGGPLVKSKRVTGFTHGEEEEVQLTHVVPFLVEDELLRLGAIFEKVANWQPFSITDGRLITGQNPASSTVAAKALLKSLAVEAAA